MLCATPSDVIYVC